MFYISILTEREPNQYTINIIQLSYDNYHLFKSQNKLENFTIHDKLIYNFSNHCFEKIIVIIPKKRTNLFYLFISILTEREPNQHTINIIQLSYDQYHLFKSENKLQKFTK